MSSDFVIVLFCFSDTTHVGFAYDSIYYPTHFGSAGGGSGGGAGGGRVWMNISNTLHIDGHVTANGEDGVTVGSTVSGGGSGGSIMIHCMVITGLGLVQVKGGDGSIYKHSSNSQYEGGGGAGGRLAMYFFENTTFYEFKFLANGGRGGGCAGDSGSQTCLGESGGPGTAFLYHTNYDHTTLIIDNDKAPRPKTKYVDYRDIYSKASARGWILPDDSHISFHELQIYGNGDFAILPPELVDSDDNGLYPVNLLESRNFNGEFKKDVEIFFKYMIGDRSGAGHVGHQQKLDLLREEIDLPFNLYVYKEGFVGLAPITFVHGVEIHLAGIMAHVLEMTLHHGGYLWLKNGGHTVNETESVYWFVSLRIQHNAVVNASTDVITDEGITFILSDLAVEGGGLLHGSHITIHSENVTVDSYAKISADGLGYNTGHTDTLHGSSSKHGTVNPGLPISTSDVSVQGSGGSHGGMGGIAKVGKRVGPAHDDIFEPKKIGSAGGPGINGAHGGAGGGVIFINVTNMFEIDGEISVSGMDAGADGGGGGAGGSITVHTNILKGYGEITAHGGAGSSHATYPGGGGGGGRTAIYLLNNHTFSAFRFRGCGGQAGLAGISEDGGAGTAFIYHMDFKHTTFIVDNCHRKPFEPFKIISDYKKVNDSSYYTIISPESGHHEQFAGGNHTYYIDELQMYGGPHLVYMTDPPNKKMTIFFRHMIGDRTGTVHLGDKQDMDLQRDEIDLPFSCRVYNGAYIGLAPYTQVYNVTMWLHGELDHVENLTVHHGGHMSLEHGGHTQGNSESSYHFIWVRVQDNGKVSAYTNPVTEKGLQFFIHQTIFIEGGGTMVGTNMTITAKNIRIDAGGDLNADALGYSHSDSGNGVNIGKGCSSSSGSSGGSHGGSKGRGAGCSMSGMPYGHLFEPKQFGSAGGGSNGGRGGGMLWLNITEEIRIDGHLRANGGAAKDKSSGGASGGSIWMYCNLLRGLGHIMVNGGDQYPGGTGGGGAAGRTAIYFRFNDTYLGTFEAHGGYASLSSGAEPGGPGPMFVYAMEHDHKSIYINNNLRESKYVTMVTDYRNISSDSFKAWVMPDAGSHKFAGGSRPNEYYFHEVQIFGNAHLALLPYPFEKGCSLYFRDMVGDRTGFVHVGPHQVMDLERYFIDTPFSSYVYDKGHLGLGTNTNLEKVFVHLEGIMSHVVNLTLISGGGLFLFQTGSTNNDPRLNFQFNGSTVIKATSFINCSNPNPRKDRVEDFYKLVFNDIHMEGGSMIKGGNLRMYAGHFFLDDGGQITTSNAGYLMNEGPGELRLQSCIFCFITAPQCIK